MNESVKFSLRLREESFLLEDPNGQEQQYVIREMPATVLEDYLDENAERVVTNQEELDSAEKKLKSYKGMHESFISLLKRTLYGPDGELIPVDIIRLYPPNVMINLYRIAQRVNDLGKPDESSAKN